MIRSVSTALAAVALAALWLPTGTAQNGGKEWGTLKGRIIWGGAAVPKPQKVNVTKDKAHCEENGPLFDTEFVVDPKTRGLKNVFVALKPPPDGELPIHPTLQKLGQKEVVLDQPRCLFIPRALAIREGQVVVAKNTSPVPHNINWTGNEKKGNKGGNVLIPAGKQTEIKDLRAQDLPLMVSCNIHPWMRGRLAVYNHPYFAVTKADGSFEIKLAPAGDYRLDIYHEGIGWRTGAKGKAGEPITIKAGGVTDLGDLKMAPR